MMETLAAAPTPTPTPTPAPTPTATPTPAPAPTTEIVNNDTTIALAQQKKNRIQVSNTKKPLFFYVNLAKVPTFSLLGSLFLFLRMYVLACFLSLFSSFHLDSLIVSILHVCFCLELSFFLIGSLEISFIFESCISSRKLFWYTFILLKTIQFIFLTCWICFDLPISFKWSSLMCLCSTFPLFCDQ